ncbi:MAG: hypothetical protein QOJ11_1254 [Frankiales bacterium]|jgi:hypothetical protein|nr:hypothetical protein [Frankiales bacterium]
MPFAARSADRPELAVLLAARRDWLRKHLLVGLSCAAAVVGLSVLLVVGIRAGFAAGHPGAVVLDAALIGLLVSLVTGSAANAWSAWSLGRRITPDSAETPCTVRRLAPETRMRRDYLQVTAGGITLLVRCAEDAPTSSMAESMQGAVLGWPTRRGGIVLLLPHLAPVAATVGRHGRHLTRPRAQSPGA